MADHYATKVEELSGRRIPVPKVDPVRRLRDSLDRRLSGRSHLPPMALKPVTQAKLRDILKKYKGEELLVVTAWMATL